jgi:hypothetical protein
MLSAELDWPIEVLARETSDNFFRLFEKASA